MAAPGAFARATAAGGDAINRAPAGDLVGVVTFADAPAVAAPLGPDRAFARSAIDAATPGFGATRYRGALSAAVQALGGRRGTIVVVTDLQESGWDAGDRAPVPESARDRDRRRGRRALEPRRHRHSCGRRPRDRLGAQQRRRRARDARAPDARRQTGRRVAGDGGAARDRRGRVRAAPPRASTAAVTVDDRDGIAADDVRYALLDSASRPALLIVTSNGDLGRDAFYVQQALSAGSAGGRFYRPAAVDGRRSWRHRRRSR